MSLWRYANPVEFMRLSGHVLPIVWVMTALTLTTGLIWGFFFTPPDSEMGATVKIIFLHVPTATMAVNAWAMMLVTSLIWFIRRHHVSALAARAAAPVGAVMTVIALITGAIWGQPTWNTWWEWDPRLTSFLILFLFYLGYMALWEAVEDSEKAADLTAITCMVGSVFALLSRYAVLFWNQGLHQDASMSLDKETHIANVYYFPLVISLMGMMLLFLALVLLRTRTEIRAKRIEALAARAAQRS
ncbi:heme ABC transporter permease CcmC [Halovulum sp. GXIMD14793]